MTQFHLRSSDDGLDGKPLETVDPIHIQAAASGCRSLFEMLVDLKLLEVSPSDATMFHAFTFVERFRGAEGYVRYAKTTGRPVPTHDDAFVSDTANATKYDNERLTHWGKDKNGKPIAPKHWSGLDMAARCHRLATSGRGSKYVEFYRDRYPKLSVFIHSGLAGLGGFTAQGMEAGFGE